jgi:hypothetical protein
MSLAARGSDPENVFIQIGVYTVQQRYFFGFAPVTPINCQAVGKLTL